MPDTRQQNRLGILGSNRLSLANKKQVLASKCLENNCPAATNLQFCVPSPQHGVQTAPKTSFFPKCTYPVHARKSLTV